MPKGLGRMMKDRISLYGGYRGNDGFAQVEECRNECPRAGSWLKHCKRGSYVE